jgi:hypothetical protein
MEKMYGFFIFSKLRSTENLYFRIREIFPLKLKIFQFKVLVVKDLGST